MQASFALYADMNLIFTIGGPMLDIIYTELFAGFPDRAMITRVILRLLAAAICGAFIGYERETTGHAAGIRTHMLVCLGAVIFILAPSLAGAALTDISRVIQGVATGIGFLGAGSILKQSEGFQIKGLTTAADLWVTTAIGVSIGLGYLGLALLGAILTVFILVVLHRVFPARIIPISSNHTRQS